MRLPFLLAGFFFLMVNIPLLIRGTAPIVTELTSDESATFHFINGNCEATPPEGFEEFFGQPPYHRFIEPDDPNIAEGADVLSRIRDFPECETPEDTMRELMREGVADCRGSTIRAIQYLYEIMEKSGPFDGVIGYSEGATLAATLLLFEQVRKKEFGIPAMLKCGVFFMGWPPLHPKWLNLVLADETDMMIEVPTTHISESSLFFFFFSLRFFFFFLTSIASRIPGPLPRRLHGALQRV